MAVALLALLIALGGSATAAGADSDSGLVGVSAEGSQDDTAVATLTVVHEFTTAGQAVLACGVTNSTNALDRKITAIQVDTLSSIATP